MSAAPTILVVDDEPQIRRLLRTALERAGYGVAEAASAREAIGAVPMVQPEVVLLDLGLPDRDGLEIVPLIARAGDTKVLVVSAREAVEEKVAALDLGAVDFVTKPFDTDELLARVRAALRQRLAARAESKIVRAGEIEIDLLARAVRRGEEQLRLTPKEYGVLAELAKHPGRVLTHAQLLRAVWGVAHERDVEYLRVTVRGLRAKVERDPAAPELVVNEPGVGYRLSA